MAESWGGGSPTRCYFVYSTADYDTYRRMSVSGYIYLPSSHSSAGSFPRYWSGWWGSGSRSDSFSLNINGAGTTSLIASGTYNVTRLFGSSNTASFAISGSTYWGSASHSMSLSAPARAYLIPRPPKDQAVVRNSDTQATITWTRDADASNQAQPWTGVYVERWSQSSGTWTRIATITAAGTTSYSDTGIVANDRYKYRLLSYNGTGSSAPVETTYIATTPSAPIAVFAEKQDDLSIVVTWTNTANYQSGSKILDNDVEVGTVGAGIATWADLTPNPAIQHTYKIVAVADDKESVPSTPSNTVQLQAPPNAPTNVAPGIPTYSQSDDNPDGNLPKITWKHNPVDSSVQRKYLIRIRKTGDSTWQELTTETSDRQSSGEVELAVALAMNWGYDVGQYEIQVKTWGADPDPGPYSATATFRIENNPAVALISPETDEVIDRSRVTAEWSYTQAQGRAQQQFVLTLKRDGNTVWTRTVNGTATSYAIPYTLLDDTTYSLSLDVVASNGLRSGTQSVVFSVDYAEPALPELTVEFSIADGSHNLSINNPSEPIETVFNRVYRCIDQNSEWMNINDVDPFPEIIDSEWEFIGEFAPNTTMPDYEGLTYGRTVYRVEAVSEIPSSKTNAIYIDVWSTRAWIGAGDNFSFTVSVPYDIAISDTDDLQYQDKHWFDGRILPVLITGEAQKHTMTFAGSLDPFNEVGSTWEDLRAIAKVPGTKCYRDLDGRRIYITFDSGVKSTRKTRVRRAVSFNMSEVARG